MCVYMERGCHLKHLPKILGKPKPRPHDHPLSKKIWQYFPFDTECKAAFSYPKVLIQRTGEEKKLNSAWTKNEINKKIKNTHFK